MQKTPLLLSTILLLTQFGCEPPLDRPQVKGSSLSSIETPELRLSDLPEARLQELVLIVFKSDYSRDQWKQVFDETRRLSKARREADLLKQIGLTTRLNDAEQARLDELENVKLESTINLVSRDMAFMMAWGDVESCAVGADLVLTCQGPRGENPVDGGRPIFSTPFQLIQPTRKTLWNYPWLETNLRSSPDSPGEFEIQVKLQAEERIGQKLRLSGEAIIEDDAYFELEKGGERVPHHKYGYVELTLLFKPE